MAEYIVVANSLRVPTGKENPLTRLPDCRKFVRGEVVDSDKFDTEAGRDKIERLLRQGALRDPDDTPNQAKQEYASAFDVPLERDPGGEAAERGSVVKLPGDDIDDEGDDDSEPETVPEPTDDEPTDEETNDDTSEPVAGNGELANPPSRGASTAVWQQYAGQVGLDVSTDASRSEIQSEYDRRVAEQG